MAQTLQTLSIISFAAAGVFLVLAIFIWFFFKIPSVIGDLSGRTARKSIAKMRANNEKNGTKIYKESKNNSERGKITNAISAPDKPEQKKSVHKTEKPETGLLADNKAENFQTETTGLLVEDKKRTADNSEVFKPVKRTGGKKLEMIEEVMLIHTDEVIE